MVVVLAEAVTAHIHRFVGVPVSSSLAIGGVILGMGIVKGINTVSRQTLANIFIGWSLRPVVATLIVIALYLAIHLRYVPRP